MSPTESNPSSKKRTTDGNYSMVPSTHEELRDLGRPNLSKDPDIMELAGIIWACIANYWPTYVNNILFQCKLSFSLKVPRRMSATLYNFKINQFVIYINSNCLFNHGSRDRNNSIKKWNTSRVGTLHFATLKFDYLFYTCRKKGADYYKISIANDITNNRLSFFR